MIRNNHGFTLVEVLIALVLFSIGMLAIGSMQLNATYGNVQASMSSNATNIAITTMEGLIALGIDNDILNDDDGADDGSDNGDGSQQDIDNDGIDDIPANGDNFGLDDTVNPDGQAVSADGTFTIFWNVANDYPMTTTNIDPANPIVKTINVIVAWNEAGANKSLAISNIKVRGQ